MWRDLLRFVRSVFLKWQGSITGGIIAVAFWAAPAFGFNSIRRRYYAAAAVLAFLTSVFRAWRDEYQRGNDLATQLAEAKAFKPPVVAAPEVELRPHATDDQMLVDVVNTGTVQATVQVLCGISKTVGGRDRFDAAWSQGQQGSRLMAPGQQETLILAKLDVNDQGLFQWLLQYPRPRPGEHRRSDLPAPVAHVRFSSPESSFDITLNVITVPQAREPVRRTLTFGPKTVTDADTGEVFRMNGHFNNLLHLNQG